MPNETQSNSSQAVARVGMLAGAGALVAYGLTRQTKTGIMLATAGGLFAYQNARLNGRVRNRWRLLSSA